MRHKFKFITRNYKHELMLAGPEDSHSVLHYTDELWHALCRRLLDYGFTGLVFYAGYHPFEHLLDYKGFPKAAPGNARERAVIRKALNRGLEIAVSYGLETYLQHYVMHFTKELAKYAGILLSDSGASDYTRLACYDTPVVRRYSRYCYREVFRQCPNLTGLYFNFESTGDSWKHVANTALPEANKMRKKPVFVYRLWGVHSADGIARLIASYKGWTILAHKISDTADTYHLPVADSRIREWKAATSNTEFMYLVGPCHNCATNIDGQVWADYDFVQAILADAEKKGCDSISFNSTYELLAADLPEAEHLGRARRDLSLYNTLHLEAVTDYFRGVKKSEADRCKLMAERLGVGRAAGKAVYKAVTCASRGVLTAQEQFLITSANEGRLMPFRTSLIQDPFLYPPVSELARQTKLAPKLGPWLPKQRDCLPREVGDSQYIIDFVDPSRPVAVRNPRALAREIKMVSEGAMAYAAKFEELAGKEKGRELVHLVGITPAANMWVYHQILAAISYYSVYFATNRRSVCRMLEKGISHIEAALFCEMKDEETHKRITRMYFFYASGNLPFELAGARRALRLVQRNSFPMGAYVEFLASRREYNEIRRFMRPESVPRLREWRRVRKQINRARDHAMASIAAMNARRHGRYRRAVEAWINFLDAETASLNVPRVKCSRKDNNTFTPLSHEQCFRWGESYSNDFSDFFCPGGYHRDDDRLSFKVRRTKGSLLVTLKEEGIDMARRFAHWNDFAGSEDALWTMVVHVAPDPSPEEVVTYRVAPKGAALTMQRAGGFPAPLSTDATSFVYDDTSWELMCRIPFRQLGVRPSIGDMWGFNVSACPAIARNRRNFWRRTYEMAMNPAFLGKLEFV